MGAIKLSDTTVAALVCPAGRKDILLFDMTTKGFGIRVTSSGKRLFLYQYRIGPKIRRHALGAWPTTTVAQARKLAEVQRGKVIAGGDPHADKKAKVAAVLAGEAAAKARREADSFTVDILVRQWTDGHLVQRSASYKAEAPRRLRGAMGTWLTTPVAEFDRKAAVAMLDKAKVESGPVSANRIYAYGRACFRWAMRRGAIDLNPFEAVPKPAQEQSRERFLSDEELALVWQCCAELDEPWRSIFKLLILTGQRRGEVAGMRWDELTLEPAGKAMWSLPGTRTKNGRAHEVPLSPAARDIIISVPQWKDCPLVLSVGRDNPPSGFGKAKLKLDHKVELAQVKAGQGSMPEWTLHDLRRSVATGLQRLGVRLEVTEAILNHVSGSRAGIVGVYQRHAWTEEKRAALEGWATQICGEPS